MYNDFFSSVLVYINFMFSFYVVYFIFNALNVFFFFVVKSHVLRTPRYSTSFDSGMFIAIITFLLYRSFYSLFNITTI